jgi:MFS family permease
MGTVADHIGRRRLLIIASILFICFSLGYGIDHFRWLLAIARCTAQWSGLIAAASAIRATTSRRRAAIGPGVVGTREHVCRRDRARRRPVGFSFRMVHALHRADRAVGRTTIGALLLRPNERGAKARLTLSESGTGVIVTTLSLTVATFGTAA